MSHRHHFSQALAARPQRLHVAAHSHHPWPDVTREAHLRAWDLAAARLDEKWEEVFGAIVPEAAGHVARRLGLPDPTTIAFAGHVHELFVRVLSALPTRPRVLTTDAEFHSTERQLRRLEEDDLATVHRVAVEPFASFPDRFAQALDTTPADLVLVSQVLFTSGYVIPDLPGLLAHAPDDALVLIDGYHGYMALPTNLGPMADRVFYTSGSYKYGMAGEGAAFLHAPPGWAPRPRNTGWFAMFDARDAPDAGGVAYPTDGGRFRGATLDPTPLLRLNAVQRWLDEQGLDVAAIHAHALALQQRLLDALAERPRGPLAPEAVIPPVGVADRGNFLTFRTAHAGTLQARLAAREVITDRRGDCLRIGFGLYHEPEDVEALVDHLAAVTEDLDGA